MGLIPVGRHEIAWAWPAPAALPNPRKATTSPRPQGPKVRKRSPAPALGAPASSRLLGVFPALTLPSDAGSAGVPPARGDESPLKTRRALSLDSLRSTSGPTTSQDLGIRSSASSAGFQPDCGRNHARCAYSGGLRPPGRLEAGAPSTRGSDHRGTDPRICQGSGHQLLSASWSRRWLIVAYDFHARSPTVRGSHTIIGMASISGNPGRSLATPVLPGFRLLLAKTYRPVGRRAE